MVHDLGVAPYPFADASVDEVYSSHVVEHVPDLILFMNEVHRILKPGGEVEIRHPYAMSKRAFQDPTHVRFIPEETWAYFSKAWRVANGLDHYPITADFDVLVISGDGMDATFAQRNQESLEFARRHYWNVIADLVVRLKKR